MNNDLKISVCVATYNGGKYIKEQIESILIQLSERDEIIISDDSSSDDTFEIIESFQDKRIRVFPCQKFKSPVLNFENAILMSAGDIIFLADQDDKWLPGKVSKMVDALGDHDIVVSDCFIGDENLNIVRESHFEWRNSKKGFWKNLMKNSYLGCCIAFRRCVLDKAMPFPRNIAMHDIWLGLVSEIYYKPIFIPEKLIVYRRHNLNATQLTADFKSKASLGRKMYYRFSIIIPLIYRILNIK